jgi:hypothetical protein
MFLIIIIIEYKFVLLLQRCFYDFSKGTNELLKPFEKLKLKEWNYWNFPLNFITVINGKTQRKYQQNSNHTQ